MTKSRFALLFPLLLLTAGSALCAATFDPRTMMDVSEVQRGAKAISRSVFAGTEITEFNLQIIDIMHQANLGSDMILARVLDGPVVSRQSGIIGGMSGSPVYIDGRLIGAIAWGWGFQKEPIAGIMPIRPMLEALDLMDDPQANLRPGTAPRRWTAARPFTVGGQTYHAAQLASAERPLAAGTLPLRPVTTPINCSGMGARTLAFLKDKFAPYGIEPMAGGGQKADPVPVELVPGAAVGVRFMSGDLDMTGIGTITHRQGDKLLAFGHPLMQLGKVNMPLTTAWINDFMPSYQRSNKMGSGMLDVGALRADIPWAIGGQLGRQAPLIPARIEVVDKSRNYTRTFNIKVMRHPGLTPLVLASGISSALEATFNPGYEGTIRTSFEIKGERGATLKRSNQYYVMGSPVGAGTAEVMDWMGLFEDNRWEPQEISGLVYRAEISDRDETVVIEKVFTEETVAKAGQPLHVHVLLRPDDGQLIERVLTVKMPLNLPKGSIRLGVSGGQDVMYFRGRFGVVMPEFDDLRTALRYVENLEQNKQLCVLVGLPTSGMTVGGTTLMNLPASVGAVLSKSSRTDVDSGKEELLAAEELPWVVYGRQMLSLAAEDRQGEKGAVTASPATPPAPAAPKEAGEASASSGGGLWWLASAFKTPRPGLQRPEVLAEGLDPVKPAKPASENKKKEPQADDGAAKLEDDDEEEDDAGDKKDEAVATVVRQPSLWTQSKGSEFAEGEATGLAVRKSGALLLSPSSDRLCAAGEFYLWNVVNTPQGLYYATANPGRVYRRGVDGKSQLVLDTGLFGVRGLAADAQGNVYAGTWPGGRVHKLTPDGKSSLLAQLDTQYIWSLAFRSDGKLVAGTGPDGRVYEIDSAGQTTQLAELPQAHVLSVLPVGERLYLATAGRGLVYSLSATGDLRALMDAEDDDVTALTTDGQGAVYAGTGTNGRIYKLAEGLAPELLFDEKTLPVYALLWQDRLLAATGGEGKLVALNADHSYDVLQDTEATHLLCLAPGPPGTVCVGSANAAALHQLALSGAAAGSFTSSVLDAKRRARWGKIDWLATVPAGTELSVQTRSGNSANAQDGTWSAWSAPYGQPGSDAVTSPAARYLQYRVQMKRAAGADTPLLRRVSIGYLPANQRPTGEFEASVATLPLKATAKLTWTASDDDKDTLLATLQYRRTGTDKWELLTELPADKKTCDWDTSKLKDGLYDLRLGVSDEPSNPGGALTAEHLLHAVRVDNARPELRLQRLQEHDGKLLVEGLASDNDALAEVACQVKEQWRGVEAVDGLFDGQYEQFRLALPLQEGKLKAKLRVRDRAGNVLEHELVWPQP